MLLREVMGFSGLTGWRERTNSGGFLGQATPQEANLHYTTILTIVKKFLVLRVRSDSHALQRCPGIPALAGFRGHGPDLNANQVSLSFLAMEVHLESLL